MTLFPYQTNPDNVMRYPRTRPGATLGPWGAIVAGSLPDANTDYGMLLVTKRLMVLRGLFGYRSTSAGNVIYGLFDVETGTLIRQTAAQASTGVEEIVQSDFSGGDCTIAPGKLYAILCNQSAVNLIRRADTTISSSLRAGEYYPITSSLTGELSTSFSKVRAHAAFPSTLDISVSGGYSGFINGPSCGVVTR